MNEPEPQTAEGQERARVTSSFSLRFMLIVSLVFASVFGVTGYFYESWSLAQQLMFLAVVCGWSLVVGVCLYFALWRRRRMNQQLGALCLRIGGLFSTRKSRWLASAGVIAVFFIWIAYVVLQLGLNAEMKHLDAMMLVVAPLNLALIQGGLLFGLLAQPGKLEFYEQGLYTRQTGPRTYGDVDNWSWSTVNSGSLIIVIGRDGVGTTFSIPIREDARAAVQQHLQACLSERATTGDNPRRA